jgi:heme/copper-type cytochrome/quinol oxidase subunit 4
LIYGIKNSKLGNAFTNISSLKPLFISGFVLSFLLAVIALLHHYTLTNGAEDTILFLSSIIIAILHLLYYLGKIFIGKK